MPSKDGLLRKRRAKQPITVEGQRFEPAKLKPLKRTNLADPVWRLNNLYNIVNEDGELVKFKCRPIQEEFLNDMWFRNVILKSRQHGFCLDPRTRVLTSDLRWVAIEELTVGQSIVAVDEYLPGGKGKARKMREASVQAVKEIYAQAYRITLSDGRSVVCTDEHPWLSCKTNPQLQWRSISGKGNEVVGKLKVGTKIKSITTTWGEPDHEDGWVGGLLDGEGTIAKRNVSAGMTVMQRDNSVLQRLSLIHI